MTVPLLARAGAADCTGADPADFMAGVVSSADGSAGDSFADSAAAVTGSEVAPAVRGRDPPRPPRLRRRRGVRGLVATAPLGVDRALVAGSASGCGARRDSATGASAVSLSTGDGAAGSSS